MDENGGEVPVKPVVPVTSVNPAAPWAALPPDIAGRLRPFISEVVELIIASIPEAVPDYAMPLEGRFGLGVRRGVSVALNRFLDLPGSAQPALVPENAWVYENLGRGEVRAGRSLSSLLAAYRTGARVTFRAIAERVDLSDLSPDVIVAMSESLFAYIDELSAASATGYALEQSERAGEHHRLQAELLDIILRGDASEGTVMRLATSVGWTVPEQVHLIHVPDPHTEGLRPVLGSRALIAERGDDRVVLVPATRSASARRALDRELAGRFAVIGPVRPLALASESWHLARAVCARRSVPDLPGAPGGEPMWAGAHLAEVIVHGEPIAMAELAARRLAPLDALRPAVRERLAETLLSWLRHDGQRAPIAAELYVHTQTVGYRVGQLKELFGEVLEDADARFELELVLRAGHR